MWNIANNVLLELFSDNLLLWVPVGQHPNLSQDTQASQGLQIAAKSVAGKVYTFMQLLPFFFTGCFQTKNLAKSLRQSFFKHPQGIDEFFSS